MKIGEVVKEYGSIQKVYNGKITIEGREYDHFKMQRKEMKITENKKSGK